MNMRLLPLPLLLLSLSLFLCLGTVKAATHVNISIGQEAATDPADVKYVDGKAPAELRAGPPANTKHHSDFSFRGSDGNSFGGANYEHSHSHSQASARLSAPNDGSRTYFNANANGKQSPSAQLREQNRQNQEFERYIQNYHSGPTVETVFESASPSPASSSSSSSSSRLKSFSSSSTTSSVSSSTSNGGQSQRLVAIGSRPAQVHTFERQVSLPTATATATPTATLLPPSDDRQTHTILNHQPKTVNLDVGLSSSSSSSNPSFDQSSYDSEGTSFNTHNYGFEDNDVQHQYPPTVDEAHINFGSGGSSSGSSGNGFYSGSEHSFGGSTPAPGYLPSYHRPLVTKTIQIAQPALKAKKYEIRHPAVQKEFYDIEERVLIKPAGTIVVELERPVAKIPKGETVLPLGHPHPAVASAYHTNGQAIVQTMGSDVVGNGHINNQYSPSPVYHPQGSSIPESQYSGHGTTIGSAVTTTPSYDSGSKNEFVEANLNKQYNADAQYVTTTERSFNDDKQGSDGFYVTTTESNRNYGSQFYGRDETDRRYPQQNVGNVEVKHNGAPGVSTDFAGNKQYNSFAANSQPSYASAPSQYQPGFNDNTNQFNGEFFSGEFYNHQQSSKPARLQEPPRMRDGAIGGQTMHVIKHEHNFHLSPSQHNIYLGRLEQESSFNGNGRAEEQSSAQLRSGRRYNEEAAQVLQIKPYLKHHPGSVVVYAAAKPQQASSSTSTSFSGRYTQQPDHEHSRYDRPAEQHPQAYGGSNVQYSAPYTSMRYYSDQTPRYIYGNGNEYGNYKDRSANLAVEGDNPNDDYQSDAATNKKTAATATQHHAHIQIQIPHHPKEVSKPIMVTTASPIVHNVDEEVSGNYRSTIAQKDNRDRDAERFSQSDDYRLYQNELGDNNRHQSARYEASQTDGGQRDKSLRIVESNGGGETIHAQHGQHVQNVGNVDVNLKSTVGHVHMTPGSRVIAATPAPTDAAAASESFHKRRIVVNHPFQTVREVVEHEPITNYHQVQVNEPASPQHYHHTAPYYHQETHGALRQVETVPVLYQHHSTQTHGNLHYAPVVPLVHGLTVDNHHHG